MMESFPFKKTAARFLRARAVVVVIVVHVAALRRVVKKCFLFIICSLSHIFSFIAYQQCCHLMCALLKPLPPLILWFLFCTTTTTINIFLSQTSLSLSLAPTWCDQYLIHFFYMCACVCVRISAVLHIITTTMMMMNFVVVCSLCDASSVC